MLELDVSGEDCDSFTAGSVDLSGASRANPVLLKLDGGAPQTLSRKWLFLTAAGLQASDAEKFAFEDGTDAKVVFYHEALYIVHKDWKVPGLVLIFR